MAAKSSASLGGPANEVRLLGRVSGEPEVRELPSGDRVVTWRLVVPREPGAVGASVDTVDCAAWSAAVRRRATGLREGEHVRVVGRLRRRFWRGASGPASRYEVEVVEVVRTTAA